MSLFTPNSLGSLDPNGEFATNTALAQALMSGKRDTLANSLLKAQMFQKPMATPTAPQLKFGVEAKGVGDGIMQGLGNAFNNALQMKQYGQQQDQVKQYNQRMQDLSQQMDLAAAQKQQQADLAAAQQQEYLNSLPDGLRQIYQNTDDIGRRAIQQERAKRYTGADVGAGAGAEQTEKDKAIRAYKDNEFQQMSGMTVEQFFGALNAGQRTPQMEAIYRNVYGGDAPADLLEYNKRRNETTQTAIKTQSDQNNLEAQPGQLERREESETYANHVAGVKAKYAEDMAKIDKLTAEGKLDEAAKTKTKLAQGEAAYNAALANLDKMTPGERTQFNSQMKSHGMPFSLPMPQKLGTVSKDGKITQFYDPYTGTTMKPNSQPVASPAPAPAKPKAGNPTPTKAPAKAKPDLGKAINTLPISAKDKGKLKRQAAIQGAGQAVAGVAGAAVQGVKGVVDLNAALARQQLDKGAETQGFWGLPFNPDDPTGIKSLIYGR